MTVLARKKILVFAGGTYVFGAEINILDVMRMLCVRGHDVRCVVSGWNDGDFIERLRAHEIPYYSVKLGFIYLRQPLWTLDSLVHYPGSIIRIARIMSEFKPDFVYHQGYRSLLMSGFLSDPTRTIVHVMDAEAASAKTRFAYRIIRRRATAFVAASRFIKQDLIDKGVASERIRVAYPPIHIRVSSAAQEPRIRHAPARIGIVGQLIPRKGHLDLLEALSRLRKEGHSCTLEVYGRGSVDWTDHLKASAIRLELAECVTWHGFVSDRSKIYGGLDVVVVPTRDQEAFGMVAAEPALWGLPVVASASGGLPEIVINNETGLLFPPGDVDALTDKLRALLLDADLRQRLGSRAKRHVGTAFTDEACAVVIDTLLEELPWHATR